MTMLAMALGALLYWVVANTISFYLIYGQHGYPWNWRVYCGPVAYPRWLERRNRDA